MMYIRYINSVKSYFHVFAIKNGETNTTHLHTGRKYVILKKSGKCYPLCIGQSLNSVIICINLKHNYVFQETRIISCLHCNI